MCDVGYVKVMGDSLCARFQHQLLLSVDILTSPIYAPNPCDINLIEYPDAILVCDLPSKI